MVVDFTVAAAVRHNVPHYAQLGLHAVIGTSGLSEADLTDVRARFERSGANVIVVANFAIGAVLLMHFAASPRPTWTASR